MRRLLSGIVIAAVLVAVVTGCGGAHRYDARLVVADSLMQPAPDSALALIEALPPDSLTDEGDRAYRDLLLTQSRYRCYITATSDSGINRALAYYRAHSGEREKLTRAYIYKGAVMEELGHPDSAMYYYKHAEATADEKDYANLGQINIRIASLYRIHYGDVQTCFDKYKQALHYHQLTGNKPMQQNCLYNMALFSSILASDSTSLGYLSKSLELSVGLNDSSRIYECQELLCRLYLVDENHFSEAKQIALKCLNDYGRYVNKDLILDLASIYAIENKNDSAIIFLEYLENASITLTGSALARKNWVQLLIAENNGDIRLSKSFSDSCNLISDSLTLNENKSQIQSIENANIAQQARKKNRHIDFMRWLLISFAFVFVITAILVAYYHFRRIGKIKAIIRELEHTSLNKHEELLERIDEKDVVINQFVKDMVAFMQVSIDSSERDPLPVIRKRIKESIGNLAANDEFWNALRNYLDREYDNMISEFAKNPRLDETDLRLIELMCCGFNYVEIAIAMNYNPTYISTKRKNVARKLRVWGSLHDYLDKVCQNHSQHN